MNQVAVDAERLQAALVAAAAAAGRNLPVDGELTMAEPPAGGPPESLIPGPDARAVSAALTGGLDGTLLLLVSAGLADAIERSPFGDQYLTDGVDTALQDAVSSLSEALGMAVRLEAPQEIEAGVAFAGLPERAFAAVPMMEGARHLGTLALLLDAPDSGPAPAAEAPAAVPATAAPAAVPAAEAPRAQPGLLVADELGNQPPPTHAFEALEPAPAAPVVPRSLQLLRDVEMGVTAELGRTRMTVRSLLELTPGSVIELDRAAGSPVDVLVNGTLIARGEVVVIDEEFGIRISEIVSPDEDDRRRR
jgi:flagellar motor switch protein FliN/FliY